MKRKKVVLLYLDTGGGHRAAATAIRDHLTAHYSHTEAVLYNPLKERKFLKMVIEGGYDLITDIARPLWPFLYRLNYKEKLREAVFRASSDFFTEQLRDFLEKETATHIAILHYLLIRPVKEALAGKDIKTLLYILDPFTVHPIWLHDKSFPVGCFSPQAAEACLQEGYSPQEVKQLSFIVNPKFLKAMSRKAINRFKRKEGLRPDRKLILIAGGGSGLRRGKTALRAALDWGGDADIAVVCGRSVKTKRECEALVKRRGRQKQVKIYGFVDFMYELINCSDLLIGKAGPAFIMEAALLGKPLILIDYMYGQEEGNVRFVEEEGLGFMETTAEGIGGRIAQILGPGKPKKRLIKTKNLLPCGVGPSADMLIQGL